MTAVRIGILGLGQRGLQHLRVLWRLQEEGVVRVVALADAFAANLAPEKIARFVPGYRPEGHRTTTEFDRLLEGGDLDALVVAIPPGQHDGEVIRAARAGVHLFVEKPMSLSLTEARAMAAAIKEAGVIATVGFQQRYDRRALAARDFLRDKRVVMLVEVSHGSLESHSVKHTPTEAVGGPANRVWAANQEWSGSTVVEAGIHPLDLMRFWAGDVAWVQAAYVPRDGEDVVDGGDNPYAYAVTLGFQSGAVGSLLMSRLRRVFRHEGGRTVLWSHGHLKWEGEDLVAYQYDGPYPPTASPAPESLRRVLPLPASVEPLEGIHRTFLSACASGDASSLHSTFESSMNSLAAVLAANESHARNGERILLDDVGG